MTSHILLCTYQGEAYLEAQLASIEGQTESNFRLLLSDDASTDQSFAIAEEAAARDARIAAVRRKTGSGSAARHFLEDLRDPRFFSAADAGDYYLFSDQDDCWHPDKLAREVRAMQRLEQRYGRKLPLLVHCDMRVVNAAGQELSPSYVRYQKMNPERRKLCQLLVQNNVTGGAMLMNHALVRLLVAHPVPEHAVMHDHWIALVAAAFGRIAYLDRALYDYRQHTDNVLGARQGSAIGEVKRRLGLSGESLAEMNAKSGAAYRALFLQAAELEAQYGGELPAAAKKTLQDFLALQQKNRLGKAVGILRGGFTFNLPHRTLGELFFL